MSVRTQIAPEIEEAEDTEQEEKLEPLYRILVHNGTDTCPLQVGRVFDLASPHRY